MTGTRSSSLAETIAAAARASLASQGLLEEANAYTVESVAQQLGAAGVEPDDVRAPRHGPEAARAIARARAAALRAAGEPTTPPDVPREKPVRKWQPVKPWASQRSRARFVEKVARTSNPRFSPKDWCDRTWAGVRTVFNDTGGNRACTSLGELPRALALRARVAILREQHARGDTASGIDWTHITARGIAACAIVLWREGVQTRKRGFARVLVGCSQNMIAGLFRNPHGGRTREVGARYHRNTLFASQLHGDPSRGGWVRSLERAGFVHIEQPPGECVPDSLRGPSGFALAQYWITERAACGAPSAVDVAELHAAGALEEDRARLRARAPDPPDPPS